MSSALLAATVFAASAVDPREKKRLVLDPGRLPSGGCYPLAHRARDGISAEGIAGELEITFYVIHLEGFIARHRRDSRTTALIYDEMAGRRCICLFNEFDAVGANLTSTNDVEECAVFSRHICCFEERNSPERLVVCSTKHLSPLDRA